jgi:hypothetical protein
MWYSGSDLLIHPGDQPQVNGCYWRQQPQAPPQQPPPAGVGPAAAAPDRPAPDRPPTATVESSLTVSSWPRGHAAGAVASLIGRLTSNVSPHARHRNS